MSLCNLLAELMLLIHEQKWRKGFGDRFKFCFLKLVTELHPFHWRSSNISTTGYNICFKSRASVYLVQERHAECKNMCVSCISAVLGCVYCIDATKCTQFYKKNVICLLAHLILPFSEEVDKFCPDSQSCGCLNGCLN